MTIVVVGMLDEREDGLSLLKERIEQRGHGTLLIDVSIGTGAIISSLRPDITNDEVAKAGGITIDEISQVLGISLVNSKVLLHRSRNSLKDLLLKHNYQEELL